MDEDTINGMYQVTDPREIGADQLCTFSPAEVPDVREAMGLTRDEGSQVLF